MHTLTLDQKIAESSIHDIESAHFEREIEFKNGTNYAVIKSSYYGGKGYTTHKTKVSAAKASNKLNREGFKHIILDRKGNSYDIEQGYYEDTLIEGGGE